MLAKDVVRYVGEPVAVVAAEHDAEVDEQGPEERGEQFSRGAIARRQTKVYFWSSAFSIIFTPLRSTTLPLIVIVLPACDASLSFIDL